MIHEEISSVFSVKKVSSQGAVGIIQNKWLCIRWQHFTPFFW